MKIFRGYRVELDFENQIKSVKIINKPFKDLKGHDGMFIEHPLLKLKKNKN
jgi:hypothetical protein